MLKTIMLSVFFVVLPTAYAVADTADELTKHLNGFTSMKANFKQTIVNDKNKPVQNSSGSMVLKRPGLFRWYTHQPNRQILVVKSDKLWIYDLDLEQLTINRLNLQQDSAPAVLLSDTSDNFAKIYTISSKPGKAKNSVWFTLVPKSEQDNFVWMKLLFNDSKLLAMQFKDKMEQTSKIKFSNIILDKKIQEKVFTIKPPKDVDVIDNTAA